MTIYHEKAKALAYELLQSEASKDYADAKAAFRAGEMDDEATTKEFLRLKAEYEQLVNSVIETLRMNLGLPANAGSCCRRHI